MTFSIIVTRSNYMHVLLLEEGIGKGKYLSHKLNKKMIKIDD